MKWEYRTETTSFGDNPDAFFNVLGASNWEAVGIVCSFGNTSLVLFKRPIKSTELCHKQAINSEQSSGLEQ
jgi:hypothetical protein